MRSKLHVLVLAVFLLAGCATVAPPDTEPSPAAACDIVENGKASFYADKFNGRRTANGERFSNQAMTAAHRTLPFGTKIMVENPSNGRSVVVRINDRGPFIKGRVIDLSKAAAREIGIIGAGVAPVQLKRCAI